VSRRALERGIEIQLTLFDQQPKSDGSRERPYETVTPLAQNLNLSIDDHCDRDDTDCAKVNLLPILASSMLTDDFFHRTPSMTLQAPALKTSWSAGSMMNWAILAML
jgi:hypothetical protein